MLKGFFGKPGKGKTLNLVASGYYDKFKKDNPPLKVWFYEKILKKDWIYKIRVYSDFPVIFKQPKIDKEGNYIIDNKTKRFKYYDELDTVCESYFITSIPLRIFNMHLLNRFQKGSLILIDEIQTKYDSTDYKDFPDSLAHFCQIHRHLDLDINYCSQSQSRVMKRINVLTEEYDEIISFRKIFHFAICQIRTTYDMKASLENGLYSDDVADADYCRKIINLKKIGNMYDSKYLNKLQDDAIPYKTRLFNSKFLSKEQLLYMFFPTKEEKENLKNMRY